jgi:hypothetical protein
MRKDDNEWKVTLSDDDFEGQDPVHMCELKLNGETYYLPEYLAGLAHCVLLLVDAINDKAVK